MENEILMITEEKMQELRMKYRNIPYLANWKK